MATCAPNSEAAANADYGASENHFDLENVAWPGHLPATHTLSDTESNNALYVGVVTANGNPRKGSITGFVELTSNVQDQLKQVASTSVGDHTKEFSAEGGDSMKWKIDNHVADPNSIFDHSSITVIPECPDSAAYYQ